MTSSDEGVEVLPSGTAVLARWSFLLDDLPDDIGGGFFTGEFVLRSDGALLRRAGSSFSSGCSMRYRALGGWQIHHQFEAGVSEETARQWLGTKSSTTRSRLPSAMRVPRPTICA